AKRPFKVITDQQLLQVLGTHFNISNYTDDQTVKTTLLEGSLRMKANGDHIASPAEVVLKSGDQGIVDHGSIRTIRADTAEVLAWKNGFFICNKEPLESIMKRISRWYDVEVVYQDI